MKTIKTMLYNVLTFITQYEWHKIEDIEWRTLPDTHKNGKYGDYTYIKKAEGLVCIHPSHHRVYLFDDKRLDGNKMIRIPLFQSFSKYRIVGISTRDSYYKKDEEEDEVYDLAREKLMTFISFWYFISYR